MTRAKQKQKKPPLTRRVETKLSERYFEGLPVIDAKQNLRVFVNTSDIKHAHRKNPRECVYAQACKRLFDSKAIVFLRTKAYVDLPDNRGVRKINRFELGRDVANKIQLFDKTGEAHPGGFLLSAPAPSQSLDAQRKAGRVKRARYREEGRPYYKRRAIIKGARLVRGVLDDVRYGKGMVHFSFGGDK